MAFWGNKPSSKRITEYAAILTGIAVLGQLSFSGLTPVKNIAMRATENIAGIIGVAGSVEPNEFNTLAIQIDQKNKELALREEALTLREKALTSPYDRITLYVLFGVTGLLLLLLLLNFFLDWKRGRAVEDKTKLHHDEFSTRL